jgi:uncharacterized protein (DUF305 family)
MNSDRRAAPTRTILLVIVTVTATILAGAVFAAWNTSDDRAGHDRASMMTSVVTDGMGGWHRAAHPRMGMMGQAGTTAEPDYLADMVAHHREAVAAARELTRSERPAMRRFGKAIVRVQSAQIRWMSVWLADWYPEQPASSDYRPMMRDLSGLSGDRLDRAFLRDMIPHHMVAVMMSQRLLMHGTAHERLARLARSIRDDQHAEIITMSHWLSRWHATGGWGRGMMHG